MRSQKAAGVSSEQIALQELKIRLARKGLTPEAFYRVCDTKLSKSISTERFKSMIHNFKLELSRGQIARLILILDEDQEGNITLQEYYNALEAYDQSGEEHYDPNGSDYYAPFEHRAMFTLLTILADRKIQYDELFRACDVDNSGDIDIKELENVLQSYSAEFYQKDCVAIHNFFDTNKDHRCSQEEFFAQI